MPDFKDRPEAFVAEVIKPVIQVLGLDDATSSGAAIELLLGTAIQESLLSARQQFGGGPALGLFQMEPNTHNDIWANFLKFRQPLADSVKQFLAGSQVASAMLRDNDQYAAAMARVHYHRMGRIVAKQPLPAVGDIAGMAAYWKAFYNTPAGAGTPAQFIANWESHHGAVA
jgi:hypothetical protein